MLRGRTRVQTKAASEDGDAKRTSAIRHEIVRAQTADWLTKEAKIQLDINTMLSEQRRVTEGRKKALWKSWVYHISSPLTNAVVTHLDKKFTRELSLQRRHLYRKYIEYSNDPMNVLSLDYVNKKKYNPFDLRDSHQVVVPKLRDPLLMSWRERDEEKMFVQSNWPLKEEKKRVTRMIRSPSESIFTPTESVA